MSRFIILTAQQADAVRGPTVSPAALNPIGRQGGVWILGEAVLWDPAHAMHHDVLAGLPQMDAADPAFSAEIGV